MLTHKKKVTLARKLRTEDEHKHGVWLFQSLNWRKRKWQIMQRVKRQEIRAKYHSEVKQGKRG